MRSCRGLFRLATVAAAAAAAAASLSVEAAANTDPSAAAPQQQQSQSPAATLFESAKAVLECHVCKVRREPRCDQLRGTVLRA